MLLKPALDGLVYVLTRMAVAVVQSLRLETCQFLATVLSYVACDVFCVRGRVVDGNLRSAFPSLSLVERRNLTRRMWAHWILMGCEIAHAPRKIHRSNYHQYVSVHRRQELVHFLLDSRPRLLVSGHFGNFELGGFMTGLLGFPTFTVARSLDNPYLDRYVNRFRGAHGQAILPKQGSSGQVDSLMKSGQILTILGDQYAGPKGCWVDFFGHPTSCHKAIALFTLTAGAPLAVVYARRVGGPLQLEIGLAGLADPRLPGPETQGVVALTEWYNRRLEELIFRSPEQYWWLHRRWRERPGRRGSVKRHAA